MFSCEFCEIFKNIIFYRTPPGDCFCRYYSLSSTNSISNNFQKISSKTESEAKTFENKVTNSILKTKYGLNTLLTNKKPKKWLLKEKIIYHHCLKDLLILSSYFTFSASFIVSFIICLQIFMHKETSRLISMLYIVYFEFLL